MPLPEQGVAGAASPPLELLDEFASVTPEDEPLASPPAPDEDAAPDELAPLDAAVPSFPPSEEPPEAPELAPLDPPSDPDIPPPELLEPLHPIPMAMDNESPTQALNVFM